MAAKLDRIYDAPVLRTNLIKRPVKIAAVELLRLGKQFLVRARSTEGAVGIAGGHGAVLASTYPILVNRVAPFLSAGTRTSWSL